MTMRLHSLHVAEASLVLEQADRGAPVWRHLGARVDPACLPAFERTRTPASFSLDGDYPLTTAPAAGLGWFGPEVAGVRKEKGGDAVVPVFDTVSVDAEADRLVITLADGSAGLQLVQTFAQGPGGAILCDARITNTGTEPVSIEWLASAMLPLSQHSGSIVSWHGRHNGELVEAVEAMPRQAWRREGRRGISGHGGAPGLVILDQGAAWSSGMALSLQLAWSGDSVLSVERDDEGFWVLSAGARLLPGDVVLGCGESFAAPQAILGISGSGRNGAMAIQHAAVRARLDWGGEMRSRPVHLNSWEACYFDHDADRIVALAEAAAAVGVERFILDDGWFRGRNDDTAGLGDWTADPVKYPDGLGPLARRVTALGMEFGLWVEPEMINPDSDLYRAHPDWVLAEEGRDRPTARNQLVLDMTRAEVRDYLFDGIDRLLSDLPVSYLKWDHNRDLAPAGGWQQVQGTYDLLSRLRRAHPCVEIESCAGGGGRSDAGIAAYTHRFWTSDNIDAVSRIGIQRGFLAFLPPEIMGAHIGASPSHATGRSQSLAFRAAVAMTGHFGVELDPRRLTDDERTELAGWIAFHKQWRDLLHGGGRIWLGEAGDGLAWQAQGGDDEFLLHVVRAEPAQDRRPQPLRLPFLADAGPCRVELLRIAGGAHGHAAHKPPVWEEVQDFTGSWLANAGLPLPPLKAESVAIFHVSKR